MKKIKAFIILTLMMILCYPYHKGQTEEYVISKKIENKEIPYDVVKVTMYTVDPKQTDSTPLLTASGFKIDSLNPEKHRIIAVSRDLKLKYKFGTKVMVKGTGTHDGIYVVRDIMNKRWRNRIDILVNPRERYNSFKGVKMYRIETYMTL
jgi:3D (Asp-Asp-Asp) domain-containing protein